MVLQLGHHVGEGAKTSMIRDGLGSRSRLRIEPDLQECENSPASPALSQQPEPPGELPGLFKFGPRRKILRRLVFARIRRHGFTLRTA
jgi:hypothetical protein